jgi:hypothetical protein
MYRGTGAWCTIRHYVIVLEISEDNEEYGIVGVLVLLVCC